MIGQDLQFRRFWGEYRSSRRADPKCRSLGYLHPSSNVPYMFTIVSVILRHFEVGKELQ
jgi:hypothetical protein